MIIHSTIKQGSAEWLALRSGKLTASIADKLMTPTGKLSTSYKGEIGRIIAERMGWQAPKQFEGTEWTTRGLDLESHARLWFTLQTGLLVSQAAFIESDDHLVGFSPDGLLHDGLLRIPLELKCPMPGTHIKWLLEGELPPDHVAQVHFSLAVTEAPYAYFMSYCPEVEPLLIKVEHQTLTERMADHIETYKRDFRAAFKLVTGEEL